MPPRPAPLALGLLLAVATALPCRAQAPTFSSPGPTAFLLEDLAREEGLEIGEIRVAWESESQHLAVEVQATPFPLGKATPFLMIAGGSTTIDREGAGRRMRFPLLAPAFAPHFVEATPGPLAEILDRPFLSERSIRRVVPESAPPHYQVQALAPPDLARKLVSEVQERLGIGALTAVCLQRHDGERFRIQLQVPTTIPQDQASPGAAPRSLPSWHSLAESLTSTGGGLREVREGPAGAVVLLP